MQPKVDWIRYWSGVYRTPAPLAGPEVRGGRPTNVPQLKTTEEVSGARCLVLLGVPGMGKTTEMRRLAELASHEGAAVSFISLGRFASTDDLRRVISGAAERQAWLEDGSAWQLFLDGLDESPLPTDDLVRTITGSLRSLLLEVSSAAGDDQAKLIERLSVRISCRTAEWPAALEAELLSIWDQQFRIYELSQLSPNDASAAAAAVGIDKAAWDIALRRLQAINAEPLTLRPITLQLLLNAYSKGGELPTRQVPLYRRGALALLEENNEERRRKRATGLLDPISRLMVAARIAAAQILSGSTSIWTGATADTPPHAVPLSEISGGVEVSLNSSFSVGETELLDVLRTALFTPLSEYSFVWAHQTFAEFSAAYYLVEHGLSAKQIADVLHNAKDPEGKIPPQLHEVAAWAASIQPDFFREIVSSEPEILLRSDVASADPRDRSTLIRELLARYDAEELYDVSHELAGLYWKLSHPRLEEDLLPYLRESAHSPMARRAAIQIAVACEMRSLSQTLAELALNQNENIHLRAQATAAVSKIGTPEAKAELRPLAIPGDPADVDDELRGWALRALWPAIIGFRELLTALTPRKRDNLLGGYWWFVHEVMPSTLTPEEAILALRWVKDQPRRWGEHDSTLERLISRLLLAAWRAADDPRVIEEFADLADEAVSRGLSGFFYSSEMQPFGVEISSETPRRKALARELIERHSASQRPVRALMWGRWALLDASDLDWLLAELRNPNSALSKELLADLIAALVPSVDETYAFVWQASNKVELLRIALQRAFSTESGGPLARWQRDDFRARLEAEAAKKPSFDVVGKASERLSRWDTDPCSWWSFNLLFFVDEDGRASGSEFVGDLTTTELWGQLDASARDEVLDFAEAYLLRCASVSASWVGTNTHNRPAAAGYRALRLLQALRPQALAAIAAETWGKWAAPVLASSFNENEEETEARADLVRTTYSKAPDAVCKVLVRYLLRTRSEHSAREMLDRVSSCLDAALSTLLWKLATRARTADPAASEILRFLIRERSGVAREAVTVALRSAGEDLGVFRSNEALARGAAEFFVQDPTQAWPYLRALSLKRPELVRDIMDWVHQQLGFGDFPYAELSEEFLGELYLWLRDNFAVDENPLGRSGVVTTADLVAHTYRGILKHLASRGTNEAVRALSNLADRTNDIGVRWYVAEAKAAFRRASWQCRSAADVIKHVASYNKAPPPRSMKAALETERQLQRLKSTGNAPDSLIDIDAPQEEVELPVSAIPTVYGWRILVVGTEWSQLTAVSQA